MANIERFIPFIIKWEAGIEKKGLDNADLFNMAKKTGWANDASDLGGQTMIGLTIGAYGDYMKKRGNLYPSESDLRNISFEEWLDILKSMYWDRWQGDNIVNQSVAELVIDWVWGSGKYGITIPQRVLGVKIDGIVGKNTLTALNAREPKEFFNTIKKERKAYIDRICQSRPTNMKFRNGWLNRLNDLKFEG